MSEISETMSLLIILFKCCFTVKPKVFITVFSNSTVTKIDKNVIIRKGQHMELKCLRKYNASEDVVILSWFFNGNLSKNNTNILMLNNVNNEMSGQYICMGQNKVGRENDTVNITVACKYLILLYDFYASAKFCTPCWFWLEIEYTFDLLYCDLCLHIKQSRINEYWCKWNVYMYVWSWDMFCSTE